MQSGRRGEKCRASLALIPNFSGNTSRVLDSTFPFLVLFFLRTADDFSFSILFYLAYFQPSPDKGAAWRPAFKPHHWLWAPPAHSPSKTFSLLHFTGGSGPFMRELLLGVVDLIHAGNSIQTAELQTPSPSLNAE